MPSEMVDRKGLPSSSFFSEEVLFPNEQRQVGFWKAENKPESYDGSPIASPTQMVNNFKLNDSYLIRNQKVSGSGLEKFAVGAERAANNSLGRSLDCDPGKRSTLNLSPTSYSKAADGINVVGAQYENGLFSSSLSDLFSRKLILTSNHALVGHSVGASRYEEDESLETLKEIEAKTIGNLLPSDDDLLSGVTDGLDYLAQSNMKEDTDDFDLFSSVGGLDLGEDGFSGQQRDSEFSAGGSLNAFVSEHPHGENPSRTLFVRNIISNVEDSELQTLFELYGDIRTLYTACKHRGFVMISYYDIRAAQNALRALQNKPLRRRKLDIHFSIPKDNPSEQDINNGTLAVFNLNPSVSNDELHQIFTAYGEIKDIHDTMEGSHKKSIEFYDVRAAEAALRALNMSEIAGKQIKIEAGCPSGSKWSLGVFPSECEQDESGLNLPHVLSPSNSTPGFFGPSSMNKRTIAQGPSSPFMKTVFHHGISSSAPNNFPSLLKAESFGTPSAPPIHSHSQSQGGQHSLGLQASSNFHSYSLNGNGANIGGRSSEIIDNHQFLRVGSNAHPHDLNDTVFGASGNGGHNYMWSGSQRPQPPQGGMMVWPNSPSFVNGVHPPPPRMHAIPPPSQHMLNTLLPLNNHHVGSAPSVNPSLWDRCHVITGESPDPSGFHPGSLGRNSPHYHAEFLSPNMFPCGNFMDMAIPSKNMRCMMLPGRGPMIPMLSSSFDSPNERSRTRRNEGNSNQGENKKQFELDLDRIMWGDDKRTTLMIKNIPNKYTSKMLLAAIDERHRGTYDFIYLPIDFKNKCNVGYAFINMTDPPMIVPFYQAFNGKKWEKFNSEKVATLTYARIQGKTALIAHFQNSSLMNEDKRCRPILFNTDGPNAGDQVPFPMGVNIRPRVSKTRTSTSEENYTDSVTFISTGEELTYEDSTSTKDSD